MPEQSGPCVCGDPCWIGPEGDGCDYALYDSDSKAALLGDRALLVPQVEDIERKDPRHPRLGQWRARVGRLDDQLAEIEEAERCVANGEAPRRPRAGIVPRDQDLTPSEPDVPIHRAMRRRRRLAMQRSHSGFERRQRDVPCGLDPAELDRAETELRRLEALSLPSSPQAFARRIDAPVLRLYNTIGLYERLWAHNRRCSDGTVMVTEPDAAQAESEDIGAASIVRDSMTPAPRTDDPPYMPSSGRYEGAEARMATYLRTQWRDGLRAEHADLAHECGLSKRSVFRAYPAWCILVKRHNQALDDDAVAERAAARLQSLKHTGTAEPVKVFAKAVRSDPGKLKDRCPDIVHALKVHNRAIDPQGCHVIRDAPPSNDAKGGRGGTENDA